MFDDKLTRARQLIEQRDQIDQELRVLFGELPQTRRWRRILDAENIGQRDYFDAHGAFPEDQRAFVVACLHGTVTMR